MWLFLIFVAIPIIEIGLFIQVGGYLGLWTTLAVVVLTALVGTTLMRAQGVSTMQKLQSSIQTGRNPADPIANGAFILIAGLLLLTPGFFTDAVGFALLIPPVRQFIIGKIGDRLRFQTSVFTSAQNHQSQPASETVLDGEYEIMEDGPKGNSGWTKPNE